MARGTGRPGIGIVKKRASLKPSGLCRHLLSNSAGGVDLETFTRDLRHSLRTLSAKPGFTLIALLALTLGIGANTALFSVINGVLLRPLPYPEPDRLVRVWEKWGAYDKGSVSYSNFKDWQDQNQSFEKLAAHRWGAYNFTGGDLPERLIGQRVSADFFSVLRVAPAIGRDFKSEEDQPGGPLVAIISDELWARRFGRQPSVLGKSMVLNDESYTIIAVAPADFRFSPGADVFVPIHARQDPIMESRLWHPGIQVIGRLRPGVRMAQATADMAAIAEALGEKYPDTNKEHGITIGSLYEATVGDVRSLLWLLMAAVAFVLLIACANVANLTLARAAGRQREMAIRSALGASRSRLTRLMLAESMLLACLGGALGLMTAFGGTGLALKALPDVLPRAADVKIDGRVLLFTLTASIITGVIFGLVPALQVSKTDLNETLKEGGRSNTGGRQGVRNALVVAEIALALVLLVGAGLLIRSIVSLGGVSPGFDPKNLLSFQVSLSSRSYNEASKVRSFYKDFLESVKNLPGVRDAAATDLLPFNGDNPWPFFITGRPAPPRSELPLAMMYVATTGYFDAMRIPLLRGRVFDERDNEKSPRVALVDENMASKYFPGQNPIGQYVTLQAGKDLFLDLQIIGVAGHIRQQNLDTAGGSTTDVQVYRPFSQEMDQDIERNMNFVVRGKSDPVELVSSIRNQLGNLDSNVPLYRVKPMEQLMGESFSDRRFALILLGLLSILALVLASIGIYGVISYSVAQREHEIGIRMALGAGRGQVLVLVLGSGAKLALAGVGIGAVGALLLTRFLSAFLFGVDPADPLTFAAISIFLFGVALLASLIPARRAMQMDPIAALRCE
jgi:putative ABC transport system permease protein